MLPETLPAEEKSNAVQKWDIFSIFILMRQMLYWVVGDPEPTGIQNPS